MKFALVDGEITGKKNISSATFKDQESAYLAGLAAAYTTKSDQVGFIGGMEGPVIQRFQSGFEAGVKAGATALNKEITVNVQYAASYDSLDKGKAIAASMYKEESIFFIRRQEVLELGCSKKQKPAMKTTIAEKYG